MNRNKNINRLKLSAQFILSCGNDIALMHKAVHEMYELYCVLTNVSAENQNDQGINLPSGKAISPAAAAHCLLEMIRTTRFLRGIHRAIQDKLITKNRIRILYAGCGPYASLITPILSILPTKKVTVDLLDINKIALQSAQQVINGFGLEKFIGEYYLNDAATFQIENNYDIVISETLQAALKNEPFVAIYQNLVPQTPFDCIYIPEEVVVVLKQNTIGNWNAKELKIENQQLFNWGELIKINKTNALKAMPVVDIQLNNAFLYERSELKLYTKIVVYKDEILTDDQCSLNMPVKICELKDEQYWDYQFTYSHDFIKNMSSKTQKLSV